MAPKNGGRLVRKVENADLRLVWYGERRPPFSIVLSLEIAEKTEDNGNTGDGTLGSVIST